MTQHIPMDGTPNFRDLGGYTNRAGRTIKRGKIFRSGNLSQLSAADLDRISALKVATICDYRRPEEVERDPTLMPDANPPKLVSLSIDPGSRGSFFDQLESADDKGVEDLELDMAGFMVGINRAFPLEFTDRFGQMLLEIEQLQHDEALLFNCAAGKDRTGFAAALILMCLDVPRETILQDYMLTGQYFAPDKEIARLQEKYADFGFQKMDPQLIRPMLEVREEYINEAFIAIDEKYSSTEDYLDDCFGFDEARLETFRAQLLEA